MIKRFIPLLLLFTLLGGCAAVPNKQGDFTDDLGNVVQLKSPVKVAALTGSLADMWTLAGGALSAVTHDAFTEKRVVGDTAQDVGGNKNPSAELIIESGVNFAILSANLESQVGLKATLQKAGIQTAHFSVETFADYLRVLKIFTEITGKEELYKQNGTNIQGRIDAAVKQTEGKTTPKVLLLRAFGTGVKAKGSDSMAGAILKDLGCENIADGGQLEDISLEAIIAADPDFIFVTTMGESTEKAMDSLKKTLTGNPAWQGLSAVKNEQYVVLPKELFHYSPNVRWGESYEQLAEILYG